jgi:hypothetical protein
MKADMRKMRVIFHKTGAFPVAKRALHRYNCFCAFRVYCMQQRNPARKCMVARHALKINGYEKQNCMVGIGQSEPVMMGFPKKKRRRGSSVVITLSSARQFNNEEKLAFAAQVLTRLETELTAMEEKGDA